MPAASRLDETQLRLRNVELLDETFARLRAEGFTFVRQDPFLSMGDWSLVVAREGRPLEIFWDPVERELDFVVPVDGHEGTVFARHPFPRKEDLLPEKIVQLAVAHADRMSKEEYQQLVANAIPVDREVAEPELSGIPVAAIPRVLPIGMAVLIAAYGWHQFAQRWARLPWDIPVWLPLPVTVLLVAAGIALVLKGLSEVLGRRA